MNHNHTFSKFMHDLIDSGIWAKLSATARTLYPVLCKFTNESFKPVWPGTDELLRLTGFKTKKSLQIAKKELIEAGLIDIVQGNGRTTTRYYFRFNYHNSKIDIDHYRDTIISLRGGQKHPPGEDKNGLLGDSNIPPNNINININTSNKQEEYLENIENLLVKFLKNQPKQNYNIQKNTIVQSMINKYGQPEIGEAIKIAISRGKNGDINYLEGILRNRKKTASSMTKNNQIDQNISAFIKEHFPEYSSSLEYYYLNGNTYYYMTRNQIPIELIEKTMEKQGYQIKIIYSPLSDKK